MLIVDFGLLAIVIAILLVAVILGLGSLFGWTFVHKMLRRESIDDEFRRRNLNG